MLPIPEAGNCRLIACVYGFPDYHLLFAGLTQRVVHIFQSNRRDLGAAALGHAFRTLMQFNNAQSSFLRGGLKWTPSLRR
jgi:hypothetical protein